MQITITIMANKDDAADFIKNVIGGETVFKSRIYPNTGTPINSHTTEELEKALAENREETIDVWLADAKRTLRNFAEDIRSAVERSK